jgi:hypothetical protein
MKKVEHNLVKGDFDERGWRSEDLMINFGRGIPMLYVYLNS